MASTQDLIVSNLVALGYTQTAAEAIYAKFAQILGTVVDNTLNEVSNSESIIINLLFSQYGLGKVLYYIDAALAFQYGDDLVVNMNINPVTKQPYLNDIYAVTDVTKQIIKQASFSVITNGPNSQLVLKVATVDNTGNLTNLSPDQLTAFQNYMLTFEIPGLPVTKVSSPANVLNFTTICTYISSYDLSTIQANVATALAGFQVQPINSSAPNSQSFNGELYMGQLQDYIKNNVPGIKDFYTYATALDGVPFAGFTDLPAGYFNYNPGVTGAITYNAVQS